MAIVKLVSYVSKTLLFHFHLSISLLLQAIATNPTSMFLIGSLVASTVIASQLSSFALVGQTLTFDSQQGGLIRYN